MEVYVRLCKFNLLVNAYTKERIRLCALKYLFMLQHCLDVTVHMIQHKAWFSIGSWLQLHVCLDFKTLTDYMSIGNDILDLFYEDPFFLITEHNKFAQRAYLCNHNSFMPSSEYQSL